MRALREHDPDSVYVNTSALAPAVAVAKTLGIPTTLHIHETWGPTERRLLTALCRPADSIVVVGEATRQALPPSLRQRAMIRRHRVIAPPPDVEDVHRIRKAAASEGEPLILFAGRWTPGKGVVEILDALAGSHAHLLVLGGPPPSGQGVDVAAEVARRGLDGRVTIVGEVPDVFPYIYACDAVAVPSVAPESYPTIALEAIAAGRPVLAADIGGLPEIVRPGTGWLLSPGDVQEWTSCLAALSTAPDLQQ
jgi:glycosyltransferase involved in cell wall biosynthesis